MAFLLLVPSAQELARPAGSVRLGLQVDANGIFIPVVRFIKVEKVVPASPAAREGLEVGDLVLEVHGVQVGGATSSRLQRALRTSVDQTLRLKIKHGTASEREVTLAAEPKPAGQ